VTSGVERVVLQVLATSVVWISDFAMLIVMFIGLILVDPLTAVSSFAVFLIVGLFMHRFMNSRAGRLGVKNANLNISSNEKIVEVFASYRESVVRNRRDYYAREIGKLRYQLADTSAEMGFLPYVSKYVIETSVVIGAVMIGSIQFLQQNASQAIATISIFLAAGSRIAPAVLRLQQGSITINTGLGVATPTLDLIESLGNVPLSPSVSDALDFIHEGFNPEILIQDVNFKYPNTPRNAISNINVKISSGSSLAVIGPSGAGKTTLIDVLLGVLHPDSGSIRISGLQPLESISRWPGGISYVPQDIMISAGTIRENVALGYPLASVTNEAVLNALKVANLGDFVNSLPDGIETVVGERGARLSGGQRQRLGIARAMFTRPCLLVLDEATSSLDGETEAGISESIQALHGVTTVVVIAHRLSTVKSADLVVYLSEGEIIAKGSFEEVKNKIADFDKQAKMLGI
jgi:ABC-type multidrug transport system fused ATPase/permease subunit